MFSLQGRRKKGAVIEAAEAQETDDIGFALQLQNSSLLLLLLQLLLLLLPQ